MTLSDIRDYIETLTQGAVYIGPIPDKPEKMVGVYNSKHQHEYKVAIGGPQLESYGTKYGTVRISGFPGFLDLSLDTKYGCCTA